MARHLLLMTDHVRTQAILGGKAGLAGLRNTPRTLDSQTSPDLHIKDFGFVMNYLELKTLLYCCGLLKSVLIIVLHL